MRGDTGCFCGTTSSWAWRRRRSHGIWGSAGGRCTTGLRRGSWTAGRTARRRDTGRDHPDRPRSIPTRGPSTPGWRTIRGWGLFSEVRAAGYPGCYGQVKRYVRKDLVGAHHRVPPRSARSAQTTREAVGWMTLALSLPISVTHPLLLELPMGQRWMTMAAGTERKHYFHPGSCDGSWSWGFCAGSASSGLPPWRCSAFVRLDSPHCSTAVTLKA